MLLGMKYQWAIFSSSRDSATGPKEDCALTVRSDISGTPSIYIEPNTHTWKHWKELHREEGADGGEGYEHLQSTRAGFPNHWEEAEMKKLSHFVHYGTHPRTRGKTESLALKWRRLWFLKTSKPVWHAQATSPPQTYVKCHLYSLISCIFWLKFWYIHLYVSIVILSTYPLHLVIHPPHPQGLIPGPCDKLVVLGP